MRDFAISLMSPIRGIARMFRSFLLRDVEIRVETCAMMLARLHIDRIRAIGAPRSLADVEFRVFSQWGEDGIIQYLLSRIEIPNPVFVEFGVENYKESNTRFLLMNNNWIGLVIDSGDDHINFIRRDELSWRYSLRAVRAFITAENINELISGAGIGGDIGLLSIDITGNDYWIWKAIQVISPRIVICEYNSVFGKDMPVTVPYDPSFYLTTAHYSNLYFGASLPALCHLAEEKGYIFVGTNSVGSNAFFVRKDVAGTLPALTAESGYVEDRIRGSRDAKGKLTFLSGSARLNVIAHLPVVNVSTNATIRLGDAVRS